MAIPWLIGGLVVAAGAALAKKLSEDDDSSSSSSYDSAAESRRREEAERERMENERKKKLADLRENFASDGEKRGEDIKKSLQGWITVQFEQSPAFLAELGNEGYKIKRTNRNKQNVSDLLLIKNHRFNEIRENLKIYLDFYNVRLDRDNKLIEIDNQIEKINSELHQIDQLKSKLSKLQSELYAQL